MTNDNNSNVFKEFSDIITSHQPQTTGTSTRGPTTKNISSSRCLNCKRPVVNSNHHPFCGAICMGAWNSERTKDAKGSDKNVLLGFSKVFEQ